MVLGIEGAEWAALDRRKPGYLRGVAESYLDE